MQRSFDVVTSIGATLARAAQGMRVGEPGRRPAEPLLLYEFESCPYCRKVREALTALDLEADVRPCPKGGRRYRPELIARGGKPQFPYLVDPNSGEEMYESDAIVRYLFSMLRFGRGTQAEPSRAPARPLELWSFEASPFCRIVREKLCTLELPYRLHNVGKGSPGREAFVARSGRMQVPYLEDPNTGQALFESDEIVAYLERRYAEK
jgi:glutathione S-transferase